MTTPQNLDHLQQVHELNRVFLELLQSRARSQRGCLGLPAALRPVVRSAEPDLLDAAAVFPRAVFRLRIESRLRLQSSTVRHVDYDETEHGLCLSILLAGRHTSRQSPYQGRLLFGFEPTEMQRLINSALPDLQRLACVPGLLACAFAERQWFWHGLFSATRPEARQRLTLMALQPGIAIDWPQRRPPHAVL